jgi:heptosyltransferase-2
MPASPQTLRLLVVMPSWVGDAVMATPTLRLIREAHPGIFIGALVRPGIDELLTGSRFFDELHVARPMGVMGPKFAAAKVRPRRYDTALLLTNSFSSALIVRLAGIPRRIGYDRDARGLLLTDRLPAPKRPDGTWAPVPAVQYYKTLVARFLLPPQSARRIDDLVPMFLATTDAQEKAAADLLARTGADPARPMALLNPGGNDPAKRWPPDRFAALARHLATARAMTVLINGSPAEADLVAQIAKLSDVPAIELPKLGITLGSLMGIVKRCRLMVTNDTGPRHIAAAFGVPLVSLFGPTDHRWTTIPCMPGPGEFILTADPTLPENQVANDHPERCRIDRIQSADVIAAADKALDRWNASVTAPSA